MNTMLIRLESADGRVDAHIVAPDGTELTMTHVRPRLVALDRTETGLAIEFPEPTYEVHEWIIRALKQLRESEHTHSADLTTRRCACGYVFRDDV